MAKRAVKQDIQPAAWNSSVKPRPSADEFHEKNIADGFVCFKVDLASNKTDKELEKLQNNIHKVDNRANSVDATTGKRLTNQKPFFKYTTLEPDGSEKVYGGGWYLYTGWSDTNDPRYNKNSNKDLNGKIPVYFRAKSAVRNSKIPNFSIQWNKVYRFYYRFNIDSYVVNGGNKQIVIPAHLLA